MRPLLSWRGVARPEWFQVNGAGAAPYVFAFSEAADAFVLSVGPLGRSKVVPVETHLTRIERFQAGDDLNIIICVIGIDASRVHLFFRMATPDERDIAVCEMILAFKKTRSPVGEVLEAIPEGILSVLAARAEEKVLPYQLRLELQR